MKKVIIIFSAIAVISFILVSIAFTTASLAPDAVAINYTLHRAMESSDPMEAAIIQTEFLTQTFENMDIARRNRDNALRISLYLFILAFSAGGVFLYLYYEQKIIIPFRKLQHFAQRIAAGNLDVPLEMDRHNLFGAFTESFDIMREELRTAKENEIKADRSKKELVASLTHDITTPVASVRSAIDILHLNADDESEIKLLDSANKKLEQIDTLVTNMLHATLEELYELNVTPNEIQSVEICEAIKQADFDNLIKPFTIPDCIVLTDLFRLQQVFDNIINNSYKYANTDIAVCSFIEEEYLFIEVRDFGSGVPEKELPLLTGKFYRGANVEKTDGYGLGLHLSKNFMERMTGGLYCENHDNGFMVVIMLRLAGA